MIDLVKKFNDLPINSIIFTDIDRDGMLNGPNLEKITELTSNTSLPVIASGGVSSLEDLIQLKKIKGVWSDFWQSIIRKYLFFR